MSTERGSTACRRYIIPDASSMKSSLSFVVPALNEEEVIADTVRELVDVATESCSDFEIILVNDGSTDRTGSIMESLAAEDSRLRVHHNAANGGLGNAYRIGVELARNEYLMLICGDGGFPGESITLALSRVGEADIVIPVITNLRDIKTPFRYRLSSLYTALLNTLAGLDIGYFNGLPIHRTELLRSLDIRSDGFGFQGEILIKLIKAGHSYVQVPVRGAEKTQKSVAMRVSNWISVGRTLTILLREIARSSPRKKAARKDRPNRDGALPMPGADREIGG